MNLVMYGNSIEKSVPLYLSESESSCIVDQIKAIDCSKEMP